MLKELKAIAKALYPKSLIAAHITRARLVTYRKL